MTFSIDSYFFVNPNSSILNLVLHVEEKIPHNHNHLKILKFHNAPQGCLHFVDGAVLSKYSFFLIDCNFFFFRIFKKCIKHNITRINDSNAYSFTLVLIDGKSQQGITLKDVND